MHRYEPPCERESQARPFRFVLLLARSAVEFGKNAFALVVRYSRTGVTYFDANGSVPSISADPDLASFRGKLNGVPKRFKRTC